MKTVPFRNILFEENRARFEEVRTMAASFSALYVGQNIIRDAVFLIGKNYAAINGMPLEWLRFPIDDENLSAFTFIRKERIFVTINTSLPLSKQIYAAAHELYRIRCYLEDNDTSLLSSGSMLSEKSVSYREEKEADAFASLILAPVDAVFQQMRILHIDTESIGTDSVLSLMDIFALPRKAMILRLLEENIITEDKASELYSIPEEEIRKRMTITGKALHWANPGDRYVEFGSLLENMTQNTESEALPQSRLDSDWDELQKIIKTYEKN